jgi:hypothetical protein
VGADPAGLALWSACSAGSSGNLCRAISSVPGSRVLILLAGSVVFLRGLVPLGLGPVSSSGPGLTSAAEEF